MATTTEKTHTEELLELEKLADPKIKLYQHLAGKFKVAVTSAKQWFKLGNFPKGKEKEILEETKLYLETQ